MGDRICRAGDRICRVLAGESHQPRDGCLSDERLEGSAGERELVLGLAVDCVRGVSGAASGGNHVRQSDGTQMAIRRHSDGTQTALRRRSGGFIAASTGVARVGKRQPSALPSVLVERRTQARARVGAQHGAHAPHHALGFAMCL